MFEVGEPATTTCDPITGMKLSSTASCGPIPARIVTGLGVGGGGGLGIATSGLLIKTIGGRTSGGARILLGTGGNRSSAGGTKFPPLACALPSVPAAGNTDWSVVMGNELANSLTERSRPGDTSIVRFPRASWRESKNGSIVTVDWLSNRMINFSPIWTRVIFSWAIPEKSTLTFCSYPRLMTTD